ncbi:DNA methyltransferase [[Clostridium] scindens]|uniref:DNA methyltransferase n=1 Tax=Clostridium scindens (strain JCM 10418 / VPI 12708) TaxID=29347 RepID=UPI00298C88C4|nr:DNA methyltransferase [[Clostridium] scindens]WPB39415.1 hypothetical protein DEGADCKI_00718 [[Clostridium] scindens]
MENKLELKTLMKEGMIPEEHMRGANWEIFHGDILKLVKYFQLCVFGAVITDLPYASSGTRQNKRNRITNQKYSSMGHVKILPDFEGDNKAQRFWPHWMAEYIVWGSKGPMLVSPPVCLLPGVFRYGNPQNRIHVTEKPLQLMKDVIQICGPGGRILNPFARAGTTVLAAVEEDYEAVGIEVTDAYYKLGIDRVRFALDASKQEKEDARDGE